MRIKVSLLALTAVAFWPAAAVPGQPTGDEVIYNDHMNLCIKSLQREDKTLSNNWQKHCGEDELDKELADFGLLVKEKPDAGPVEAVADQIDDDCDTPLPYTPVAETPACGRGSKTLLANLSQRAVIRVKLPGKNQGKSQCARFIPLLLTDKTDFACNAVRSRIACVDMSYDPGSDSTTLKFFTERKGTPTSTTVTIKPSDMKPGLRLSDLVNHPQFVLLPVEVAKKQVIADINDNVAEQKKACIKSGRDPDHCETRSITKADQLMQETLRRYRDPKRYSPPDVMLNDAKVLIQYMRDNGIDKKLEHWLLFRSIAKNEVGLEILNNGKIGIYDPIYGMSDSVLDNSGFTFGAHQVDIGSNDGEEVRLFWGLVDAYLAGHADAALQRASAKRDCVNLPLRFETVRALDVSYQAAASMTLVLRSPEGINKYNPRMVKFVEAQVPLTNKLPGLFHSSMIARTIYSDKVNQSGPSKGALVVQRASDASAGLDLTRCADVLAAENGLLDRMIWKDYKNQKGNAAYHERYENIRDIIRQDAPNGGISNCAN
jgi:hypothetical protein